MCFSLRSFFITLIAVLIFVAFTTKAYWIQWAFFAFLAATLFLLSELFLNEESFANNPEYKHWKQLSEARLLDFESEAYKKK